MKSSGKNAIFCLEAGTFWMSAAIKPMSGDQFYGSGEGVTILRGDVLIASSHWSKTNGLWVDSSGDALKSPLMATTNSCLDGGTVCQYEDDLSSYSSGLPLKRVLSPCTTSNVVAGTYCINYGITQKSTIYMFDDPGGMGGVTYAKFSPIFSSGVSNILKSMTIEHVAGSAASIGAKSLGDTLEVAYAHLTGVSLGGTSQTAGATLQNSHLHDNGLKGAGGPTTGGLFANNEVDHNGTMGFDGNEERGGAKFSTTSYLTVSGNNVHDNTGNGIWFDVDSSHDTITGNTSVNNAALQELGGGMGGGNGVRVEKSCYMTISGNTLTNNVRAGIAVTNAHDVSVGAVGGGTTGNTVLDNAFAEVAVTGNSMPNTQVNCNPGGGPILLKNNVVQGNTMTMSVDAWTGWSLDSGMSLDPSNMFGANTYQLSSCLAGQWSTASGALVSFATWQANGQDMTGSCTSTGSQNRPPTIGSASISPTIVYTSTTLTASATNVSDPDGDPVTLHYAWTVDGGPAGADSNMLPPTAFTAGDVIGVTITATDPYGLSASATASPETAIWNLTALRGGLPGIVVCFRGNGFGPNETVDLHLDSATGPVLGSGLTDASGGFALINATLPNPVGGGTHMVYGVGRTSGVIGPGPLTVTSTSSISPVNLAAGDTTTFSGVGFVPGEPVALSFPGQTPTTINADANGSVTATLTSPAEPYPGGVVTAAAASGTLTDGFNTTSKFNVPITNSEPGQTLPVTVSGYGANETVSFTIDGNQVSTGTTDASGSLSANVPMTASFGTNRTLAATGLSSGAAAPSVKVSLPAFVTVTPGSGGPGTALTIASGPGWPVGDVVSVTWSTSPVTSVNIGASGSFSVPYTVPANASGTVTVKAADTSLLLSPTTTFVVSDAAPRITSASVSPSKLYTSSTATATASGVSDPDGDPLTYTYAWTVNGAPAGTNASSLPPTAFSAGSTVAVTITVTDPAGLSASATSSGVAVSWNLSPLRTATPGLSLGVKGNGYAANETVVIRVDSATGPQIGTAVADATGSFASATVVVPAPFGGGTHMLYGIGQTSGTTGTGQLVVLSIASITPVNLAVGDLTTVAGQGFVPGETVTVSFPGGSPTSLAADPTGSVSASLASPAEPNPGGTISVAATSGSLNLSYNVVSRFNVPITNSEPGQTIPVTLSGYGANETISFTIDGNQVSTGTTDASGSLSANVPMTAYFGTSRKLAATGLTSGQTNQVTISLPAFINLSPRSGPPGTVITITSGPGWIPGEWVSLTWRSGVVKTVQADASGNVSTTYTVPTSNPCTVTVKLSDTAPAGLGVSAATTFQVT